VLEQPEFAVGAAIPILTVLVAPPGRIGLVASVVSLVCLAVLGALAGRAGGASPLVGAVRVTFWGALAMALTAGVGTLFGTTVT
jgi:VIT1/CCC1 family predicted Fe2+/Mn2+ transporter